MKNKKGFVFIETIVVLVVVILSLTTVLATYSLVSRRTKIREFYNVPSDIYLLYNISRLGTSAVDNYSVMAVNNNTFWIDRNNCDSTIGGFVTNCSEIFSNHKIQNIGLLVDLDSEIRNNTRNFDNETLGFLNSLKKYKDENSTVKMKYLIGRFYRNNEYYFAALEVQE